MRTTLEATTAAEEAASVGKTTRWTIGDPFVRVTAWRYRVDGTWQSLSSVNWLSAHPADAKESPYATRDKLMAEHGISVRAHKTREAAKAVDRAGCAKVLAMGTFVSNHSAGDSASSLQQL